MLDIAHALIVTDGQGEEGNQHHAAVDDIAVEEIDRIGDAHFLGCLVDQVDQCIDTLGKFVGGADFDVGAGRRLGREVGRCFEVAMSGLGLHLVGDQNVAASGNQVFFLEAQVGVAV